MKKIVMLLILLSLPFIASAGELKYYLSMDAPKKANPLDFYPLEKGNKWTYETWIMEIIAGGETITAIDDAKKSKFLEAEVIKEERTVTKHIRTDLGLVVLFESKNTNRFVFGRFVKLKEMKSFKGHHKLYKDKVTASACLVNGSAVYPADFDFYNEQLKEDYINRFSAGDIAPDFVFPMAPGLCWASPKKEKEFKDDEEAAGMDRWMIDAWTGTGTAQAQQAENKDWNMIYMTNAGPEYKQFKYGEGLTLQYFAHSTGTYLASETRLLKFTPVAAK